MESRDFIYYTGDRKLDGRVTRRMIHPDVDDPHSGQCRVRKRSVLTGAFNT